MKIIIAALNAKYVHTSLSVRCLNNAVSDIADCIVREYTINDNTLSVAGDIFYQKGKKLAQYNKWSDEEKMKSRSKFETKFLIL